MNNYIIIKLSVTENYSFAFLFFHIYIFRATVLYLKLLVKINSNISQTVFIF